MIVTTAVSAQHRIKETAVSAQHRIKETVMAFPGGGHKVGSSMNRVLCWTAALPSTWTFLAATPQCSPAVSEVHMRMDVK